MDYIDMDAADAYTYRSVIVDDPQTCSRRRLFHMEPGRHKP